MGTGRPSVLIIAQWSDPKDNAQNIAWAKETFAALEPFTRHGGYSNYMADDEPLAGVKRAFVGNFCRLQKLKDLYDPGNLSYIPHPEDARQHDVAP